LWAVCL